MTRSTTCRQNNTLLLTRDTSCGHVRRSATAPVQGGVATCDDPANLVYEYLLCNDGLLRRVRGSMALAWVSCALHAEGRLRCTHGRYVRCMQRVCAAQAEHRHGQGVGPLTR